MKTRDPWRVVRPMGRPQTFRNRADAETYAQMNGGTVEENGRPKTFNTPMEGGPRSLSENDVPSEIRAALVRRSGGRCEVRLDGCSGTATGVHHRLKRRSGVHTMENLLDICVNCHTASPVAIHRNVAWSQAVGLLIPSWENPPIEPWTRAQLNA